MDKPLILVVGHSIKDLRDYLLDHGYEYVVLNDVRRFGPADGQLERHVDCNFSSEATMLAAVDVIREQHSFAGVVTAYENFVRMTARIAQHLDLPGLPIEAAAACTDKYLMRQLFAKAPQKISPDFAVVTAESDVRAFVEAHSFPLILKPANLSKSLLVFKNDTLDTLLANYHQMMASIDTVYAKYAPTSTPSIIIEEFMVGSVHSVDAFIDCSGTVHLLDAVVDYQTGYDIGYDDNFHYSRLLPSALPADSIEQLNTVARLGCEALSMRNSPAHIELIMTAEGPMIVEIGARNGGYRARMHRLANGVDIIGNAVGLALGKQPNTEIIKRDSLGVFELFPKSAGTFIGISSEAELRELASFNYLSIKAAKGADIGKSSDGHKAAAVVILHNPDPAQFAADMAVMNSGVAVLTY
jgi:biotin carboxylase